MQIIWLRKSDRKIIDTIPDNKPPQVTFDCTANGPSSNTTAWRHPLWTTFGDEPGLGNEAMGACTFQFWVDRIESFYCKLDKCTWQISASTSTSK
jgi:hypothetical protein